jgi:hypothetical protein
VVLDQLHSVVCVVVRSLAKTTITTVMKTVMTVICLVQCSGVWGLCIQSRMGFDRQHSQQHPQIPWNDDHGVAQYTGVQTAMERAGMHPHPW